MTTDLEKAGAVVSGLEAKRAACIQQGDALTDERSSIALAVHASGDKAARKRLDEINAALGAHASELASLDAALQAAAERVVAAQQAEAHAADLENVRRLRELVAAFREAGEELDDAMRDIGEIGALLKSILNQMHSLDCRFPSHAQLDALGAQAMATALMGTPWHKHYEHVPPRSRHTFKELISGWSDVIENGIKRRLGEQMSDKAEEAA